MAMEYDVTLLDEDGKPQEIVALSWSTHQRLVDEARRLNLRVMLQFADFHNDASVSANDVDELLAELSTMDVPELKSVLDDIEKIAKKAKRLDRELLGIAD